MGADLTTATVTELVDELCARFEAQDRGLVVLWEPLPGSDDARSENPPEATYRYRGNTSTCIGMAARWMAQKFFRDYVE